MIVSFGQFQAEAHDGRLAIKYFTRSRRQESEGVREMDARTPYWPVANELASGCAATMLATRCPSWQAKDFRYLKRGRVRVLV